MTSVQRIIKYFAIALAVCIIVTIISTIWTVFYGLSGIFEPEKDNNVLSEEMLVTNIEEKSVDNLSIKLASTNLIIKKGEVLKIETNNKYIECKQNISDLKIEEKSNRFFAKNPIPTLVIYIPENIEFKNIDIEAGAGSINIDKLVTNKLSFELGAGKIDIDKLKVLDKAKIDGGAGSFNINSGEICNLDLDMGVGEANIKTKLKGNSDIDAGIGNLNINIDASMKDYKVKLDKGIGNVRINDEKFSDEVVYGNGENYIKVDGGIGNINIRFNEESVI